MPRTLVTTATPASRDAAHALVRSARRLDDSLAVTVLLAGGADVGLLDVDLVEVEQVAGKLGLLVGDTLPHDQQVAFCLPFVLEQAVESSDGVVAIAPEHLIAGPLTELDAALTAAPFVLVAPTLARELQTTTPALARVTRQRETVSQRVLAVRDGAQPLLRHWQEAMEETFTDLSQRRPSDIVGALFASLVGGHDVSVTGEGTLIGWADFAAIASGRAAGPHCAVVDVPQLWELGRLAHAASGDEEEVAWQLLVDNVHDSRPLEPFVALIAESVEQCPSTPPEPAPLADLMREVRRASDPTGARWGAGESDAFRDWLYQRNDQGITRIADLYWRSRTELWDEARRVRYEPASLMHWRATTYEDLGGDLFDPLLVPVPRPVPPPPSVLRSAVDWRVNTLRSLLPGQGGRRTRRLLGPDPAKQRGVAEPRRAPVPRPSSVFGPAPRSLSLLGCFRSESGLGQAARASLGALRLLGHEFSYVDTSEAYPSRNGVDPQVEQLPFGAFGDVNLLHSNADELLTLSERVFRNRLAGRFNAAMWFWEAADLPERSRPAFDVVDELWVASEYLVDVFGQYGRVPVHNIGLAADLPEARTGALRTDFGLPEDEFVFLFVYDALSAHGRKNPEKALAAFLRAFGPSYHGVRFVLKVSNLNKFPSSQRIIRSLAASCPAVTVIDEYFTRDRVMDLMSVTDVYVSLHAAEGFGLTLLEAMALGTPVICTGYSGNLDFTTPDNSWLVDYEMIATQRQTGPYPPGAIWASPNTDSAADLMRAARDHPAEVDRKRQRAIVDAREAASLKRYAQRLDARLRSVGVRRS